MKHVANWFNKGLGMYCLKKKILRCYLLHVNFLFFYYFLELWCQRLLQVESEQRSHAGTQMGLFNNNGCVWNFEKRQDERKSNYWHNTMRRGTGYKAPIAIGEAHPQYNPHMKTKVWISIIKKTEYSRNKHVRQEDF